MSAPSKEKEPNKRQAAAEELAAKIKRRVESAQAAIEGGDKVSAMLSGICLMLNDVVPMLVNELQIDHGTITSTVEFPKMKDDPKSKDSTKKRKSGLTKERAVKKIEEVIEDIGFGLSGNKDYSEINYDYTSLVGSSYIENPKNLIEHLTTFQSQIDEATEQLPKTLSALKQAKKAFGAKYEAEHGEIPDDSEDAYKEYEQARKAAVKAQTTKHTGWKKALDDAKTSYAEKEAQIKQKVAKLKGLVEQWKAAREAESESPPEKKQKKDSDSDSDSDKD